ncbi:DUF4333 domain-containing protein [Nocardia sp. NPDC050435]|uniref:DUF4333 domain-containing protein n=1 Tax=Nocardia sp. NPDC050435 TaxID=3155040 RepID=UPI0033E22DB6
MTAPTRRPPNASRPYPVAQPDNDPEYGSDPNGWVPVVIAGVIAAVVIAVAGVIAGLIVVNIRESDTPAAKPTPAAASAPVQLAPIGALPTTTVAATPTPVVPDNLDPVAVQQGVTQVLTESYGLGAIKDVKCPAELPVVVGSSYECSLRIDGVKKAVAVTVTDPDGTYEVSRPR